jgi:hypothetical protein
MPFTATKLGAIQASVIVGIGGPQGARSWTLGTDRREYQESDSKSDELFSFDIGLIDSPCKGRIKCRT